jgi:hypothetical protein
LIIQSAAALTPITILSPQLTIPTSLPLYINKYPFVVGGWFRHNFQNPDAVVALVGLTYNNLRVGYSYDFTVSQVGSKAGGAHEISFAWDFCIYKEKSRKHIRAIKSPSF